MWFGCWARSSRRSWWWRLSIRNCRNCRQSVIVTRDEHEGRGPLEGLRAGLKALPDDVDAAYVTSCDVPLLVPGFVRQMLDLARGYDIAVMEIDGFTHPAVRRLSPGDAGVTSRICSRRIACDRSFSSMP